MKFKYSIGNLVALKNHPYFKDEAYIGSTISCSSDNYPLMMVKECIQSISKKETLDSATGEVQEKQLASRKYLCFWYDSFEGKFQEAILREESLIKLEGDLANPLELDVVKIGDVVYLNTSLIERYKQVHNQNKQNDHYVASSFLVTDIISEPQKEWDNAKYGFIEKLISGKKIKVQWFNVAKSRYSEELIPYECLQSFPQLINRSVWTYLIESDRETCTHITGKSLMEMIVPDYFNYKVQRGIDGQSLEELIFFYLRSGKKIILDDRVRAFDRYLALNGYKVIAYRISLNSIGCDTHKEYKVPLDLILQDSDGNVILLDILTGNGIVDEGEGKIIDVAHKIKQDEETGKYSTLAMYNGRLSVIKDLIGVKYASHINDFVITHGGVSIASVICKMLIISRKHDNILEEILVDDCKGSVASILKRAPVLQA